MSKSSLSIIANFFEKPDKKEVQNDEVSKKKVAEPKGKFNFLGAKNEKDKARPSGSISDISDL